jgi:hypothetical protein
VVKDLGRSTFRWPDRLASIVLVRLVVWVMVAAFSHAGVLSDPFRVAEWMDDHQFYSWEESDRMTLLHWHQLPEWNPYWCGGTVGIAAPEDPFLGPDFLLRLIFGVAHGRRLATFLLVVMGLEGMYRLCRRLDSSALGAAFAAIAYATCDRFVSFLHDGWVNFMGFELIPFILYFLIEGSSATDEQTQGHSQGRMRRAWLLGGACVAWIILSAGTYPTPYAMLSVGYVTLALSIRGFLAPDDVPDDERRGWRILRAPWLAPWVAAGAIGIVALCLSAGKILPTLSFLRQFPRVFTPVETHAATDVFSGFWGRYAVVGCFAALGAVTADVAAGIFCGGAALFFALAMGDFGEPSPFHLLKSLPIFGQLRFPDRFAVGVLLFASVAASRGITRLEDFLPRAVERAWGLFDTWKRRIFGGAPRAYPPELRWAVVGIAAFAIYTKIVSPFGEEIVTGTRIRPGSMYVQDGPRRFEGPFRQSRGNRRDVHIFTGLNLGSLYCVAGNPLPESALLRGDLPQEEYPQDPEKATVKRLDWTPNKITLEVDAKEPTTVLVNQNWAPQWSASIGSVKSLDKLLAVDVPAGKNVVVLKYADRFLEACLLVSLASLLGLLWILGRDAYRWLQEETDRWDTLPVWPEGIGGAATPPPSPPKNEPAPPPQDADEPDVPSGQEEDGRKEPS